MDPENRGHLAQAIGPDALTAAEAFAADLPPALVAPFEHLVWTIDQGTADQCRVAERLVETLLRQHLVSGAWFDVLLAHCTGAGWDCCEAPATPQQRLKPEYLPVVAAGGSDGR
jgi:hypothetical protein